MSPCFLGLDAGTGSCKSALLDENGNLIAEGSGAYRLPVHQTTTDQDAEAVLAGILQAGHEALEKAGISPQEVAGISLGAAMHSLLAVDAHGQPLTGAMTWADNRAQPQADALRGTPEGDALYRRTGCPIHPMYPLYKARWLKEHRPELFRRAAKLVTLRDYALYRLCGVWVTDPSMASSTGWFNLHTFDWDADALAFSGVNAAQLPEIHPPDASFPLRPSPLADALGLLPGTPVTLGCSDGVNSNLGAGAVREGQAVLMIGTSGALRQFSAQARFHPGQGSWCYAVERGRFLAGGAINNGGLALTTLRDGLAALPGASALTVEDLLALAEQAPPGAEGLVALPFFSGERSPDWNAQARGVFFGLTPAHRPAHLARAVLEGVAFRLRTVMEMLAETGAVIREIRASGGFVRSPLWLSIVASVLGQPLHLPASGETSSRGAAFWAMRGAGALTDFDALPERIAIVQTVHPDPLAQERYQRMYPLAQSLYRALLPFYDALAHLD